MANPTDFDPISFLQQIVAIDSCDPPGGEIEVANLVHKQLLELGVKADLDEFLPGRANVLGRIRGAGDKPALVLSAHMDTVPVGTVPWHRPPFSGEIADGRLHGRGATDMKSALVAMIAAAGELEKKRDNLKGDLILAFTAGESSNLLGARRFVEQGLQSEIGAFLCGEPSGLDILIAEKAALWLRATAIGSMGHVSGNEGINAISAINTFLTRLETLTINCPPHPFLGEPTVRVGRIEGGSAVNLTPDHCIADFDIRLPSGVDHLHIVRQVEEIAPEHVSISILDFKPAVESLPDEPFIKLCHEVCAKHRDSSPRIKGVSYYSDAAVLLDGIASPFAIIGPGELGLSGQMNEFVYIENVRKAIEIYTGVATSWLS